VRQDYLDFPSLFFFFFFFKKKKKIETKAVKPVSCQMTLNRDCVQF
jgi:hypothetical protein